MSDRDQRIDVGRRIVCAAMRHSSIPDTIVCGARHYDSIMRNILSRTDVAVGCDRWEQGFIDQYGVFMTREEAYQVARSNGQLIRRVQPWPEAAQLFSEDLY